MQNNSLSDLSDRAQKLLKILVECYIEAGEPIGSKTLAQKTDITISPATIRNIMADLETAGFLHSPHTSAGRIPTTKGYRLFVDSLLNTGPINETAMAFKHLNNDQLKNCTAAGELAKAASTMLSDVTKLASLVMIPLKNLSILRQVEFLALSQNRVLVILVLNTHEVQNRIIYTDRNYTEIELQQAGNFITTNFAGQSLSTIRGNLISAMQNDRQNIEHLTQAIIDMANKTFNEHSQNDYNDYVVSGENNLLEKTRETELDKLRNLLEAFTKKRNILYILDQCLNANGIKIYIGEESQYDALCDYSLITAPYKKDGKVVGALGVIGPTRMAYSHAIAAVDVTAKLLSAALEENT